MLYAVWATDASGTEAARLRVREAHRARLRAPAPHAVEVVQAGATLDPATGAMNGTLLVVEAADVASVRAFVEGDPYVSAGVYDRFEIRPWRCGLGPLAVAEPARQEGTP